MIANSFLDRRNDGAVDLAIELREIGYYWQEVKVGVLAVYSLNAQEIYSVLEASRETMKIREGDQWVDFGEPMNPRDIYSDELI